MSDYVFPNYKSENWQKSHLLKYELSFLKKNDFLGSSEDAPMDWDIGEIGGVLEGFEKPSIVMLWGCFAKILQDHQGIEVRHERFPYQGDALLACLNQKHTQEAACSVIVVPSSFVGELVVISDHPQGHTSLKVKMIVEENAKVDFFEYFVSTKNDFLNYLFLLEIHKKAVVRHFHKMEKTNLVAGMYNLQVFVSAFGCYEAFHYISEKGTALRYEGDIFLQETQSQAHIKGAMCLKDRQIMDFVFCIHHCASETKSSQIFKAVLDDCAQAFYRGKIDILKAAQESEGRQIYRVLMLSPLAYSYYKPELEIYANRVVCQHGATSGGLDDNQLFYLQSRGLSRRESQKIILQGFLNEMFCDLSKKERHFLDYLFLDSEQGSRDL